MGDLKVEVCAAFKFLQRDLPRLASVYGFTIVDNPSGPYRLVHGGFSVDYAVKKLRGAKIGAIYWVGSDILNATERGDLVKIPPETKHIAGSENIAEELSWHGITAEYVPSLPTRDFGPMPLGESVFIYCPPSKRDLYMRDLMIAVADRCERPVIWANDATAPMEPIIRDSRAFLRFVRHDGFSRTSSEFMLSGRVVATNQVRPLQHFIGDLRVDSILCGIESAPAPGAREFYLNLHRPERMWEVWQRWLMSSS